MPDRRLWSLVAAGIVAGAIVGLAIGLTRTPGYRGETTLAVTVHGVPAVDAKDVVPTISALGESDVVVANTAQAARVPSATLRGRLRVSVIPHTALVRIAYDASSAAEAARVAQAAAMVVASVSAARFSSVTVVGVDPAVARRRGRDEAGWLVGGAGVGAALGLAGTWLLSRRPRSKARDEEAPRADPSQPEAKPITEPAPVSEPRPGRVPQPGPLDDLRAALSARGGEFDPDRVAEWEAYLTALEPHVADGHLPPRLAGIAKDVFAPLLQPPDGTPGGGGTMGAS
jgi:hypothetical protein